MPDMRHGSSVFSCRWQVASTNPHFLTTKSWQICQAVAGGEEERRGRTVVDEPPEGDLAGLLIEVGRDRPPRRLVSLLLKRVEEGGQEKVSGERRGHVLGVAYSEEPHLPGALRRTGLRLDDAPRVVFVRVEVGTALGRFKVEANY